MADHLLVTTTTADRATAVALAESAVKAKLAAGAQVRGPVTSFFWHLGESGQGDEWDVVFKTTRARYAELEAHIVSEHPWDKPEVIALPIEVGSAPYLRWLETATES
ncbi:MAG TPA: divalent-cation tolerance protein CutA [Pseudonocardiaceae bacterium]|jgi:periplasmic divalent cation tolerance protein|nr:divalent-cation tolerance protein CutA [Pseudonocardiaceae bacterium]